MEFNGFWIWIMLLLTAKFICEKVDIDSLFMIILISQLDVLLLSETQTVSFFLGKSPKIIQWLWYVCVVVSVKLTGIKWNRSNNMSLSLNHMSERASAPAPALACDDSWILITHYRSWYSIYICACDLISIIRMFIYIK